MTRRQDPHPSAGALAIWLTMSAIAAAFGLVGTGWTATLALVCAIVGGTCALYQTARTIRARRSGERS